MKDIQKHIAEKEGLQKTTGRLAEACGLVTSLTSKAARTESADTTMDIAIVSAIAELEVILDHFKYLKDIKTKTEKDLYIKELAEQTEVQPAAEPIVDTIANAYSKIEDKLEPSKVKESAQKVLTVGQKVAKTAVKATAAAASAVVTTINNSKND